MKDLFKIDFDAKRVYGLDILRALAIMFVVVIHGSDFKIGFLGGKSLHDIFVFDGVTLFFVLSGFLIGGILIKTIERKKATGKTLLGFWIRRWFRTVPNYFLILLLLLVINLLFNESFDIPLGQILSYFIFAQNLISPHPDFFREAWSLTIEEWFYLLVPSLIFISIAVFKRSNKAAVLYSAFSVLVFVTLYRLYRYNVGDICDHLVWKAVYWTVICRLDSLMYGVIGAFIQYYYKDIWIKYSKSVFVLGLLLFVLIKALELINLSAAPGLYKCVFSFSLYSFATLCLLPFLSEYKSGKGVVYRTVTRISLISYSMYLLNLSLVMNWCVVRIPWEMITDSIIVSAIMRNSLYWFLTIALSVLLYKYYEVPFMKLRDNHKVKKWLGVD